MGGRTALEDEFVGGRVSLADGSLARCTIASSNKLCKNKGSHDTTDIT